MVCTPLRKPRGVFTAPDKPKSVSGHSAHEVGRRGGGIRSYLRVLREGSDRISESPLHVVQSGWNFENFRSFPEKFAKLSIKKSKIFNDFKKTSSKSAG